MVQVLPDVAAIDRAFDYLVPASLDGVVRVGTKVRVDLGGRRVAGWAVADRLQAEPERPLRPLARVTGWGPEPAIIDLARWAAWRWAGRTSLLLRTASSRLAIPRLPPSRLSPPSEPHRQWRGSGLVAAGLEAAVAVLRLPPAFDLTPVVAQVAQRGPTLVVVPSAQRGAVLAGRLRQAGAGVALLPEDWAQARAGAGVVIGARGAVWASLPGLAAVVVIDGHDEALVQEQAPTWDATAVAIERARRAGAPCLITSPCPTLDLLAAGPVLSLSRGAERAGWAPLEVVDRRGDDPRLGLYSERVADLLRSFRRVVCVLNRTGRGRLMACGACGSLARCEHCGGPLAQQSEGPVHLLACRRCGQGRPAVCASCGSSRLKQLRIGVSGARHDLQVLAGRPVGEVTAATPELPDSPVLVGTEAVLHRIRRADAVAFLDFDQELLAARYRAAEEALALLALASRLVGGRAGRVVVQTRVPGHEVIQAAAGGDPARLPDVERPARAALRLPPLAAVAIVSGEASGDWAADVGTTAGGVEVGGPDHGRWLLRAADHQMLADALAAVARPPGRLRVEVDPRRI